MEIGGDDMRNEREGKNERGKSMGNMENEVNRGINEEEIGLMYLLT